MNSQKSDLRLWRLTFLELHLAASQNVNVFECLETGRGCCRALDAEEIIDIMKDQRCCEKATQVHDKVGSAAVPPNGTCRTEEKDVIHPNRWTKV